MDIQNSFNVNVSKSVSAKLRRIFLVAMLLGGGRSAFSTAVESR